MIQVITKKQYTIGQIVQIEGKKKYKVRSSIDLKWLGLTKKKLYNTSLEEV